MEIILVSCGQIEISTFVGVTRTPSHPPSYRERVEKRYGKFVVRHARKSLRASSDFMKLFGRIYPIFAGQWPGPHMVNFTCMMIDLNELTCVNDVTNRYQKQIQLTPTSGGYINIPLMSSPLNSFAQKVFTFNIKRRFDNISLDIIRIRNSNLDHPNSKSFQKFFFSKYLISFTSMPNTNWFRQSNTFVST